MRLPLPDLTYQALKALWHKHRHPRLLFPSPVGSPERITGAAVHMDRGGTQAAMKAVVRACGIKYNLVYKGLVYQKFIAPLS